MTVNAGPSGSGNLFRFLERLSVTTLVIAGLYFLLVPTLFPGPLGWNLVKEQFGEGTILCFAVGFLFLYVGGLMREKHRLRAVMMNTLEALNMMLYGPDYRRQRDAVDVLVRTLRARDERARKLAVESLERMTGQSFGTDADAWEEWWTENRGRFRLRDARTAAGTPDGGSGDAPSREGGKNTP